MNGEWPLVSIDEIKASIAIGPFGSRMKSDCYTDSGVGVIRGNNLSASPRIKGEFVFVSNEKANELKSSLVYAGDLVFPHRGNIGSVGIVPDDRPRYLLSSSLMKLSVDRKKVDPKFLFYFFTSSIGRHELLKNASQVGTPGIATPLTSLKAIYFKCPPLDIQQRIAEILSTLDDKIALNRQINQTLEAMAQAMFKSWFVDFEPVRAKIAALETGEDPTLAAMQTISSKTDDELAHWQTTDPDAYDQLHATASLFPEVLVESELGLVPEGWEVGTLEDLVVLQRGFDLPSQDREVGPYPIIAASGPSGFHSKAMVKAPGVVTGRSGLLGKVFLVLEDYWPLNTALWVKNFNKATPHFAYYILKQIDFKVFNAGSAVPSLNRNHVHCLQQVIPEKRVIQLFEILASDYHKKILTNEGENQNIANLRDTLLPKLLSGELTVAEAVATEDQLGVLA